MLLFNHAPVKVTIFPDQTSQVYVNDVDIISRCIITWLYESENEFMHLAQLVQLHNTHFPDGRLLLFMPYLPYARQDKDIKNGNTYSLHTFVMLLNSLKFHTVTVYDPHSDVSQLIDNLDAEPANYQITSVIHTIGYTFHPTADDLILAFPDEGAFNRYTTDFSYSGINSSIQIIGKKVRDELGNITSYTCNIEDKTILDGKTILIIDDICDGGRTFELLSEQIKTPNNRVILFVSHGLFTKGLTKLKQNIDYIYTYNQGSNIKLVDELNYKQRWV